MVKVQRGEVLPVDSPANGAHLLPRRCGDDLRPAVPPTATDAFAVALSGGGFRATLAGLGVIRLLADIGRLGELRYLSSVSGGSVANGVVARAWPELRRRGYSSAAVDELVIDPMVRLVSHRSLKVALVRGAWRTVGSTTRTDVLARRFDEWFFDRVELESLDPEVRWIVSAANLTTAARFTFERDVVGDYTTGLAATAGTGIRLSQAVAASAAVPGAFAPFIVDRPRFPCATRPPMLLDGGAYDNTGLEAIDSDRYKDTFLITLNAGGLLRPGGYGKVPLVRELARANSLLYRQSTALRTRTMVERFGRARNRPPGSPMPDGARDGVLVGLASDMPDEPSDALVEWRRHHLEHRSYAGEDLALVPTVFDKLDRRLCRALVYRGWWLIGAAIAQYHPERLPDPGSLTAPGLDR
jgi:NTE family protein